MVTECRTRSPRVGLEPRLLPSREPPSSAGPSAPPRRSRRGRRPERPSAWAYPSARAAVRPRRNPRGSRASTSATRPAANMASARASMRTSPSLGRRTQPDGDGVSDIGPLGHSGRERLAGEPTTSRARITRRAFPATMAPSAAGSRARSLARRGSRPTSAYPAPTSPDRRVGRRDVEDVERGPDVQPRPADNDRHPTRGAGSVLSPPGRRVGMPRHWPPASPRGRR